MLKSFMIIILSLSFIGVAEAKGNKPCSGKKGGIKHCTSDGKFMCRDGTVSASKKKCS